MSGPELIVAFRSTHSAIAGEQALLDAGVAVRVMPLPDAIAAGCGLCLRITPDDREAGWAALRAARVAVQGAYLRENDRFIPLPPCIDTPERG